MHKTSFKVIQLIFCLFLVCCTFTRPEKPALKIGEIYGKIFGVHGKKLVSLIGDKSYTVTDSAGMFNFRDIPIGDYSIEVTLLKSNGPESGNRQPAKSILREVIVTEDSVTLAGLVLSCDFDGEAKWGKDRISQSSIQQTGRVTGKVAIGPLREIYGNELFRYKRFVMVSLQGGVHNKEIIAWTDSAGNYTFDKVEPGIYSAQATYKEPGTLGFQSFTTIQIVVVPNKTAILNFNTQQNVNDYIVLENSLCRFYFTDWFKEYK